MQTAIPCGVMRGGTSNGLYFHPRDLRQIDGMGGALTIPSTVWASTVWASTVWAGK